MDRFTGEITEITNESHSWMSELFTEYRKQQREIERLRELIKSVEWELESDMSDGCPWCRNSELIGHSPSCPAFTPDGSVK